jgi:hypothetical protein
MKGVWKMFNLKRNYINALLVAQSVISDEAENTEIGYFTYFTTVGIVTGKKVNVEPLNTESDATLAQDMEARIQNGGSVSIYQIGYSLLNQKVSESPEVSKDFHGDTQAIVLEDVSIKHIDGNTYKSPSFVLFTDQITGLVPAKLSFS